MTPEEFFLHAKRLCPERRGFSGLAGLEPAFDFGEVFGGYFGIACERGAKTGSAGAGDPGRTASVCTENLPETSDQLGPLCAAFSGLRRRSATLAIQFAAL
jgi:hypothetical protein